MKNSTTRYERCKECGKKMEAGQWTCPSCGYTQWGIILGLGSAGIACVGLAVIILPLPSVWTLLVGGLGVALFYSAFYGVGGALRWRGPTTFLMTTLVFVMLAVTSLAGRFRYTPDARILQTPESVAAAAALTETPIVPPTPAPSLTPAPTSTPQITGVVTAQLANVRQGPGIDTEYLGGVAKDEVVVLLGRNADGGWIKIKTQKGTVGWIYAPLLQFTVQRNALPEVK